MDAENEKLMQDDDFIFDLMGRNITGGAWQGLFREAITRTREATRRETLLEAAGTAEAWNVADEVSASIHTEIARELRWMAEAPTKPE